MITQYCKAFSIFQKKAFWIIASLVTLASIPVSYIFLKYHYPSIALTITMNRAEALEQARMIAQKNNWPAAHHKTALIFKKDTDAQFFIERQHDGHKTFIKLLEDNMIEPFLWHIRFFEEEKTEETSIFFTPEGLPQGFAIKLAETTNLENLSLDQAREYAQEEATQTWRINFKEWKEIETSKDIKSCGRIDHTFVYQKIDNPLQEGGELRLKLLVSGNMLTKVQPYIFIPETFKRTFEMLRSSNTIIYTLGSYSFFFLYLFLGCILAGIFFFRKNILITKPAWYAALVFGIFIILSEFNKLPLAWITYSTTTSSLMFLITNSVKNIVNGLLIGSIFFIIFSAVITWDRLAFASHLNFWNLFSSRMTRSSILIMLLALGYMFAIIFLGLELSTFHILTKYIGWWSPSNTLADPDILALPFPWLESFFQSLQAGFFEEIAFRALPLSIAYVCGKYFKKEHLFLCLGIVIQALIFAAAHANYPQMPGYFRLVEIFLPSIIFGILYIFFGLLPCIIAHFMYDFFLMSLPILIDHSHHAWMSKIIIFMLSIFPFLICFYFLKQRGSWYNPTEEDFNSKNLLSSITSKSETQKNKFPEPNIVYKKLSKNRIYFGYALGILGLFLLYIYTPFSADTLPITCSKDQAIAVSKESFSAQNFPQTLDWQALSYITPLSTMQEKFVWQTQGKEVYKKLLGSYINQPCWQVRYASFSGDITERALEYKTMINPEGALLNTMTTFPETAPGATLLQGQARGIALDALQKKYNITLEHIKELSCVEQKKPHRLNWLFIFQDTSYTLSDDAQARISVAIAGDKISTITKSIFIPEAWQRNDQQEESYKKLFFIIACLFLAGILLFYDAFLYQSLFAFFDKKNMFYSFLFLCIIFFLDAFNMFPSIKAVTFNTTSSYMSQFVSHWITQGGIIIVSALFFSFLYTHLKQVATICFTTSIFHTSLLGLSLQSLLLGIPALILHYTKSYIPTIANPLALGTISPFFGTLCASFKLMTYAYTFYALLFYGIEQFMQSNSNYKKYCYLLLFIAGASIAFIIFYQNTYLETVALIAMSTGLLFMLIYKLFICYDTTLIIPMATSYAIIKTLSTGILNPYPYAFFYTIIISIILFFLGFFLLLFMRSSKTKAL